MCSVIRNPPPLESVLPINEVKLGAWNKEVEGILSFYSPMPKSYEMIVKNEKEKLTFLCKCKGFSMINSLLHSSNQKEAFHWLIMNALRPLKEADCCSDEITPSLETYPLPKMLVYQSRININPKTFLPQKIEMFKNINIVGPQSVLDVDAYVEFNRHKVACRKTVLLIGKPPQWGNKYCQGFQTDILFNKEEKKLQTPDNEDFHDRFVVSRTAGLIPAYPFGYDLLSARKLPFEALALKPRPTL